MNLRMIIFGAAVGLALAGSSIALGGSTDRPVATAPAPAHAQSMPKSLVKVQRALDRTARVRVRCGSLQCVNGALTAIGQAFRHLTGCMSYINIARYPGYLYSNDGGATTFTTTGFDEAEPGEPATKAAIFVC
jgi:hypothetical protein